MTHHMHDPNRRGFLGKLGLAAAALSAAPTAVLSQPAALTADDGEPIVAGPWDMTWVDKLKDVPYRVVIDASTVEDGYALDLASAFMDQYHEVYDTKDDQTRAVIVMRRLGT